MDRVVLSRLDHTCKLTTETGVIIVAARDMGSFPQTIDHLRSDTMNTPTLPTFKYLRNSRLIKQSLQSELFSFVLLIILLNTSLSKTITLTKRHFLN